ncbi:hypothetical protein G3O08_20820, partial [Cryomorpha ignava]
ICAGESMGFNVSPTPTGYESLTWEFGDGLDSNDPNTTYSYPNNDNIAQYNPVLTIVNPNGCFATAVIQASPVEVIPAPVALLSPAGTLLDCGPFSATLSATVSTGFGSTTNYTWSGPTMSPPAPNCASCDTWNINMYGTYQVVVENSNGCQGFSNEVDVFQNCGSGCQGPTLVASNSSFIDCATGQANIQYNPYNYNILSETWIFP